MIREGLLRREGSETRGDDDLGGGKAGRGEAQWNGSAGAGFRADDRAGEEKRVWSVASPLFVAASSPALVTSN